MASNSETHVKSGNFRGEAEDETGLQGLLTCLWLKKSIICPDSSWLMRVLYLLVVKGIVNGVTQRRDKIWLRYQQHALLDQKLCLGNVDRNTQRRW